MKKLIAMASLCAALLFAVSTTTVQAQTKTKADTTKKAKAAKVQYTCSMHPEVLSDKPGKCPKCGMTLVVKKADKKKPAEKMKM